jgi:protein-disulfide isomerase
VRAILGVTAVAVGLWAPAALAQEARQLTLNPVMIKGPAAAPVTIVEFADYQ